MAGAAQDAISNVAAVQLFSSISVLAHQIPVLKSWAALNLIARSASTLTVLAILVCGTWLYRQALAQIADTVSFIGFATLLISHLKASVLFCRPAFSCASRSSEISSRSWLDTASSVPGPKQDRPVVGKHADVVFEDVSFLSAYRIHIIDLPIATCASAGCTIL